MSDQTENQRLRRGHRARSHRIAPQFDIVVARSRDDCFPPTDPEAESDTRTITHRLFELILDLERAGMPDGYAALYVHMLWTAGKEFGWPVSLGRIARKAGKTRGTIQQKVSRLLESGLMYQDDRGNGNACYYKFPPYEVIMQRTSQAWIQRAGLQLDREIRNARRRSEETQEGPEEDAGGTAD